MLENLVKRMETLKRELAEAESAGNVELQIQLMRKYLQIQRELSLIGKTQQASTRKEEHHG